MTDLTDRLALLADRTRQLQEDTALLALNAIAARAREVHPAAHTVEIAIPEGGWSGFPRGCHDQAGTRLVADDETSLYSDLIGLTQHLTYGNINTWYQHTEDPVVDPAISLRGTVRRVVIDHALTLALPDVEQQQAATRDELVRLHGGNATQAMLDLARDHRIAVHYLDRAQFDSYLEERHGRTRPLTDWDWFVRLDIHPEEYDEHVADHECGDDGPGAVEVAFMREKLADAGLIPDDEGGALGEEFDAIDPLGLSGALAGAVRAGQVLDAARRVLDAAPDGEVADE
ncbi:hypothetical protein ACFFR3_46070 [Nonomuraea salmonea]|uniref:Uncharacterized protein n=1 Tax=Nonomuraea salmonea TaxID=46181 RepID=A0ABV5P4P7_9ACTN